MQPPADKRRLGGRPRKRISNRATLQRISDATGIPKYKVRMLFTALATMTRVALVQGKRVYFPNLGSFAVTVKRSRNKWNPATESPMQTGQRNDVKFTAGYYVKTSI
jgi:nucleoid DNA-binding protein